MLDINLIRTNPDLVRENIKKKFQDAKLPLVDEVIAMDEEVRAAKTRGDELRAARNSLSKQIGGLMKQGKKEEAEAKKQSEEVAKYSDNESIGTSCATNFPAVRRAVPPTI